MGLSALGTGGEPGDRFAAVLVIPLTVALVALVGVFFVFYTAVRVDGDSMAPTLLDQERVLVTKNYGAPARGDLVFARIETQLDSVPVIKRVGAVAGDTIEFREGLAYINGEPEEYPFEVTLTPLGPEYSLRPLTVPPGSVMLLSDNRPGSIDSRDFGPVPADAVVGRVVAVFSPANRMRLILHPTKDG